MSLIYFDDDPWIPAHDACEKLYRDIQSQLITFSNESRSSAVYGSLSAEIRQRLKQFNLEISNLRNLLDRTSREQMITDAESERRYRQIEALQSRLLQLQSQFNTGIHSSTSRAGNAYNSSRDQEELFGINIAGNRRENVSSANWGTGSDDEDLLGSEKPVLSVEQMKQSRTEMIKDQDKGLEELSKIISRQRDIAENIGNEVSNQNEIIDDLADHIDRTDGRVTTETGQIRVIDNNDSTCRYWTVIVLLFIGIIIVAVLP